MMKYTCNAVLYKIMIVLACVAITTDCLSIERQGDASACPEKCAGYLPCEAIPNSEVLIPPPPTKGSTAFSLDNDIKRNSLVLRDSSRWHLAAVDADLKKDFPRVVGTFDCALNAPITEQDTPHIYKLMRRTNDDVSYSTCKAKDKYKRIRPFVENKERTCYRPDEDFLKTNGSYPSGHSAIGWAWALILSEISPEYADAILARGRAFGQSRVICNVHWQSDVVEGRFMGAATVARLHADRVFRADIKIAKKELAAVRAKGVKPTRDCKAEADALAQYPQLAPWPANK